MCLLGANKQVLILLFFHFDVRGKNSLIQCMMRKKEFPEDKVYALIHNDSHEIEICIADL